MLACDVTVGHEVVIHITASQPLIKYLVLWAQQPNVKPKKNSTPPEFEPVSLENGGD